MTPALIWSAWTVRYGPNQPLPIALVFGPFVCPVFVLAVNSVGSGDQTHLWHKLKPKPRIKILAEATPEPSPLRPINQSEETQLRNCFPGLFTTSTILSIALVSFCRGAVENHTGSSLSANSENIEAQLAIASWLSFKKV